MSRDAQREAPPIGDLIALTIQQLYTNRKIKGDQPLLRIDYRDEAAKAPFQFDTVRARLHRTGCRAIPQSSQSALYGVWQFGAEEREFACPQCKPMPKAEKTVDQNLASDIFYGFVSILDQFGNVLRERGREYRESSQGRHLKQNIEGLYAELGDKERETLDVILSSLDGLLRTVRDFDQSLGRTNGNSGANGKG